MGNAQPDYRCRYPAEYTLANKVDHPRNVYLREAVVLDPVDTWLAQIFAPARLSDTQHRLADASTDDVAHDSETQAARRSLTECDQRLARYRAALEAGTDPVLITGRREEPEVAHLKASTSSFRRRFSRRNAASAAFSSLVSPSARSPSSISACFTHSLTAVSVRSKSARPARGPVALPGQGHDPGRELRRERSACSRLPLRPASLTDAAARSSVAVGERVAALNAMRNT